MEFYMMHFHHIQLAIPTNRYFRLALTIAKQMVLADPTVDKVLLTKLMWIEKNTTKKLMCPLINVQLIVCTAPLNKEAFLKSNTSEDIYMKPLSYARELYIAYEEICDIVTQVAKKYSLDIPYSGAMYGRADAYQIPI